MEKVAKPTTVTVTVIILSAAPVVEIGHRGVFGQYNTSCIESATVGLEHLGRHGFLTVLDVDIAHEVVGSIVQHVHSLDDAVLTHLLVNLGEKVLKCVLLRLRSRVRAGQGHSHSHGRVGPHVLH
jgi:hypothetical protein